MIHDIEKWKLRKKLQTWRIKKFNHKISKAESRNLKECKKLKRKNVQLKLWFPLELLFDSLDPHNFLPFYSYISNFNSGIGSMVISIEVKIRIIFEKNIILNFAGYKNGLSRNLRY
jgi:hypothetical protein